MSIKPYGKAVLSNGITLVAEHHPHVRAICIGVWIKVGSSLEAPRINGMSHFIEHMVFKGTERRTPLQISTTLESLGGDLNAFTDREVTCYHSTVLTEHLDTALDVLSDLLIRPTFPKDEMERERKVLLQELSMIEESPDDWIGDLFFDTVWKDQPLGRTIIGNKKTIQGITRGQLTKYFQEHYRAENIVISVAGNIDFDELRERCEKYFGSLTSEKRKRKAVPTPVFKGKHKFSVADTEQLHCLLGFEGVGFQDPRRFDALILSFFLGGGMSSRLFQEIREKAGLAYTVDCDCVTFSGTGLFTIYTAMSPRSITKCLGIIGKEIARLKEKPLPEADLKLVKGQLRGSILLSADQMETRQESLGRNEIVFGRYVPVEEIISELEAVSGEGIHELANRIFVPEKEALVTLSKVKPKDNHASIFE